MLTLNIEGLSQASTGWIFGSTLCRILHYVNIQTMGASIFTMCSLALLRFAGMALPFRFKSSCLTRSGKQAGAIIIAITWVMGSVLALPNLSYFHYITRNGKFLTFT